MEYLRVNVRNIKQFIFTVANIKLYLQSYGSYRTLLQCCYKGRVQKQTFCDS